MIQAAGAQQTRRNGLIVLFMDGIRFFEKYKDKLWRETYKFLYLAKRVPLAISGLVVPFCYKIRRLCY